MDRPRRFYNFRAWKTKLFTTQAFVRLLVFFALVLLAAVIYNKYHSSNSSQVAINKDPCAFFTLDDAKALLGKNAQKGGVPPVARASSKDTDITTCSYTQSTVTAKSGPANSPKTAAVVVGTPKNSIGKNLNDYEFNQYLPSTKAQAVTGYGDKAYWDSQLGVLNVYRHNKWIDISNGSISNASGRSLDDSKKLADIVIPRL